MPSCILNQIVFVCRVCGAREQTDDFNPVGKNGGKLDRKTYPQGSACNSGHDFKPSRGLRETIDMRRHCSFFKAGVAIDFPMTCRQCSPIQRKAKYAEKKSREKYGDDTIPKTGAALANVPQPQPMPAEYQAQPNASTASLQPPQTSSQYPSQGSVPYGSAVGVGPMLWPSQLPGRFSGLHSQQSGFSGPSGSGYSSQVSQSGQRHPTG
ncbi:hypothetical protein F4778DRAFT_730438 [Xylariomycetidae sp. FL2044]|nr:hypothetical protein F4778DRAFT_730438 [Xylariomycetidae sp. FL2044]